VSLILLGGLAASAQPVEWRIDPAHSAAQFSVRHLMVSTVRGHFGKISGKVVYDAKNVAASSVEAAVEVASIDTREPKRDAHLKSPDFFDVEKFPAITFKSTSVAAAGPGKLKVTGDMTMHGVTKQVVFDVEGPTPELNAGRQIKSGATGTAKISRKDFGMTWNRAIEAGGVTVGDEVTMTIDLEMNKVQAPAQ
jgi:polyisoprenoid-binding protein YceI